MPDKNISTSGAAPGASPRIFCAESPLEQVANDLRAAYRRLPDDRQRAARRDLPAIVPGPHAASGDDLIDDLADMDFDDPMYLILDPQGGSDDDED